MQILSKFGFLNVYVTAKFFLPVQGIEPCEQALSLKFPPHLSTIKETRKSKIKYSSQEDQTMMHNPNIRQLATSVSQCFPNKQSAFLITPLYLFGILRIPSE